ncbi:MAG TPA: hypothetical protein VMS17_18355 [Gemmataceae bacterium]|nr:hypothetical protein [Gemmataceae bacterium]
MRGTLLSVLSLGVLVGFAGARSAADDAATAVINKAIKAQGGEEALTKYKAAQVSSKGKITLPGVGEVEFTQEIASMLPDKVKESMHLTIQGQQVNITTIMNGDKYSIQAADKDVPISDEIKNALKEGQYMLKVARLVSLVKDKGYDLSLIGESKIEDKPVVGVLVKSKDHKDVSLYFDKETGLLAKMEHRTVDPSGGKEITEERIILAYRDKGPEGIVLPKEVLVKHDGETFLKAQVVDASVLESLDDSTFKK